jgi:DNA-binding beta-propeller fold protein YncE
MGLMGSRRLALVFSIVVVVLAGAQLFVGAALASKGVVGAFGGEGSGNGEFAGPLGMAVNQSTGEVYVVDSANDRVEVFQADGTYVSQFGGKGSAAGQFDDPQGVAVEQFTGDVYVTDQGNRRVDEFEGDGTFVRAFGWGVLNGGDESEVCTTTCEIGLEGAGGGEFGGAIGYPAVEEGSGDVFVADPSNQRVDEFSTNGVFVEAFGWGVANGMEKPEVCTTVCQVGIGGAGAGQFADGSPTRVTVGSTGELYVVDAGNGRIEQFEDSGVLLSERFAAAPLAAAPPTDVAVDPVSGNLLVATASSEQRVLELEPDGYLLGVDGEGANLPGGSGLAVASSTGAGNLYFTTEDRVLILGNTSLPSPTATIEPATMITASEAILHGTINPVESVPDAIETIYRLQYSTNETEWNTVAEAKIPAGTSSVQVSGTATGLLPGTLYHTRLVAEREFAAGTVISTTEPFQTLTEQPIISDESFSNVSSNSATVTAQIDGGGLPTTYRVEYGTTTAYGSETTSETLATGGGSVPATVRLIGLQPNTEYHFRIIAANRDGSMVSPTDIRFQTLTTVIQGLPDGRVYEMVTPVENQDADVWVPEAFSYTFMTLGEGFETMLPFQVAADGNAVAYAGGTNSAGNGVSVNGGNGNEYLATRGPGGGWTQVDISPQGKEGAEYQAFSSDLSEGILVAGDEITPSPPLSTESEALENYPALYFRDDNNNSYHPFFTIKPPHRSNGEFGAYRVLHFGSPAEDRPAYAGGADAGQFLFEANDALTTNAVDGGATEDNLYDSIDGRLSLVNVLPGGTSEAGATFGSAVTAREEVQEPDFSNIISEKGNRVFWTDTNTHDLYVTENVGTPTQRSVQVDRGVGGDGHFETASSDGLKVFFTRQGESNNELYEYDTETGDTTDMTPNVSVVGVVGASNDGSYVYYVDNNYNMYVAHNDDGTWEPAKLITPVPLSYKDGNEINPYRYTVHNAGDWSGDLGRRTAEVTPDGKSVVFMSNQPLTSYPNEGLEEVYVYEVGGGRLFCASCDQSGEPPRSTYESSERSISAFLPISFDNTFIPQWISKDGDRVFFDSAVPLVPQDTNGKQNVYEWERAGTGSCHEEGGEDGGCVYLLSGGDSESASWLIGEDPDGENVFIATRAQLVAQDKNDIFDLYDARVNGVEQVPPTECSGTGCQGLPTPPSVFATPSSVTFDGVGNFIQPTMSAKTVVKPEARSLNRAQKLARALKVCARTRSHAKKLAKCEARARKRYGIKAGTGKSTSKREDDHV